MGLIYFDPERQKAPSVPIFPSGYSGPFKTPSHACHTGAAREFYSARRRIKELLRLSGITTIARRTSSGRTHEQLTTILEGQVATIALV